MNNVLQYIGSILQITISFNVIKIIWTYTELGEGFLLVIRILYVLLLCIYTIKLYPVIKENFKLKTKIKKEHLKKAKDDAEGRFMFHRDYREK